MTPTDREAKIAAVLAHLCGCHDDYMIAVREGWPPEDVERRAERHRRAEAEAATLMREPAPDGKALRALRAWMINRSALDALGEDEVHPTAVWDMALAEIDRLLTVAPVADAEVAPVREGALQGTPTRMTDADRREVDALKKRAFDEASAIVEPTPAEWCAQIMDVVARSRTRTGLSEPIRLDMEEIVCDRSELERAAKWLRASMADMLAVAQQVGIVYEADYCAPVAGPTPAILRAITKIQRDAGDADQLRSAGLSLRAENARLQADLAAAEQRQQNAEGIAAQQSVRAERAEGEAMVLRADLAAARADQAAMARDKLEAVRFHLGAPDVDAYGLLSRFLAALPQPKPVPEGTFGGGTLDYMGPPLAAALTAAIPPLPLDKARVAKPAAEPVLSMIQLPFDASEDDWRAATVRALDDLDDRLRALAGKEPKP